MRRGAHRGSRWTGLIITAAVLLSGCGATVQRSGAGQASNSERFPVTITNCGTKRTYQHPPRRAVVNDIGMTELMFALGLQQHMAGYFLRADKTVLQDSPWTASFDQVPRLAEDISKEAVRAAGADFVFAGWNYGYDKTTHFTPKALAQNGIAAYLLTESCHNGAGDQRGIMPPLRALYTDLRNLGKIFGVSERASKLISDYNRTVNQAKQLVPDDATDVSVFLYDSGEKQPLTAGNGAAAHAVITKAGGTNIFAGLDDSWTSVSWEAVVRADPDIILINDYGSETVQEKIDFLTSYPPLAHVDAVKHHRFFALPYAALVEGPRNPTAIKKFAEYLWTGPRN